MRLADGFALVCVKADRILHMAGEGPRQETGSIPALVTFLHQ